MNDLITIPYRYEPGKEPMVSGRTLHERLGIETPYRKWFPRICQKYGYEEGTDFETTDEIVHRRDGVMMPRNKVEHWLTLHMAKEICLIQPSIIGRLIRRQIIEKEQAMYRMVEQDARELLNARRGLEKANQINTELTASLETQKKELMIQALTIMRQEETLTQQREDIREKNVKIRRMEPKAAYCDKVLNARDVFCITTIAKAYDWSGQKMNDFLHEQHVQYKIDGSWVLYQEYAGKGYAKSVTYIRKSDDGSVKVRIVTKWTQKGRELIDKLMRDAGWRPVQSEKKFRCMKK